METESKTKFTDDLLLLETLDEVLFRKDVSEPLGDFSVDRRSKAFGRKLCPGRGGIGEERRRLVGRLGRRLDGGADEAVEEVGDDGRLLVREETSNEGSEDSLGGSEDHLLVEDDL